MAPVTLNPIGVFRSSKKNPVEAARQATADMSETGGVIELVSGQNFEQALEDLDGFSHLWVIYQFHQNQEWKSKVLPPRGSEQKVGVFASRSPYRPNFLGMSVLEIDQIKGLMIYVKNHDLLDGSPIMDIKPYLPYADSFPEAKIGWLENIELEKFQVDFSALCLKQLEFLSTALPEFKSVIIAQLEYDPLNSQKKRVKDFVFSYRTWRVLFSLENKTVYVNKIFSGYSESEMNQTEDPFYDKNMHRDFRIHF